MTETVILISKKDILYELQYAHPNLKYLWGAFEDYLEDLIDSCVLELLNVSQANSYIYYYGSCNSYIPLDFNTLLSRIAPESFDSVIVRSALKVILNMLPNEEILIGLIGMNDFEVIKPNQDYIVVLGR